MQKKFAEHRDILDILLAGSVLLVLLVFSYGLFVQVPYMGFYLHPQDGRILGIYVNTELIQLDDVIVKIGESSFVDQKADRRKVLFENIRAGDIVNIVINRDGKESTIQWKVPGFSQSEFNRRFFNIWWLAYIYWVVGVIAQFVMRPKNSPIRKLFIAVFYLTSLWLIFGCMSTWHFWNSSILLHATTWILLPIYLYLHWIFPKPLSFSPKWIAYLLYGLCLPLVIGELFQAFPSQLYFLGFLMAIGGSMLLLVVHFIRQPTQRREVGFLLISTVLIVAPLISFGISGLSSKIAPLTFLALPFMPLVYFYTIYHRQLGGMELRANRFMSVYTFIILAGTSLPFLLKPVTLPFLSKETVVFLTMIITLSLILVSILIFPSFQTFFDKQILGIKLPYENLQGIYSNRIAANTSTNDLLNLLENEVFPSLLIRQYAFMQLTNGSLKVWLAKNVSANALPKEYQSSYLFERSGKYISNFSSADEWIRLILPLKAGDSLIGFWLLGRRDPDDFYPLAEIPILQSLASQTAIAVSNIIHTEQLLKMYQIDVERTEQERKKLSLDLHDSILNQLALLRRNLDENSISPKFQDAYQELVNRLREIVSDLRPPMLTYGLKPAIEELADNLMERSDDKVKINVNLEASEQRIPQQIELHIFRIVQEACENSLRHANAKTISIHGNLTQTEVSLEIQDDGKGFEKEAKLELDDLLMNRHFGLAGMIERAYLIGATIQIDTNQKQGTHIHIAWADRA